MAAAAAARRHARHHHRPQQRQQTSLLLLLLALLLLVTIAPAFLLPSISSTTTTTRMRNGQGQGDFDAPDSDDGNSPPPAPSDMLARIMQVRDFAGHIFFMPSLSSLCPFHPSSIRATPATQALFFYPFLPTTGCPTTACLVGRRRGLGIVLLGAARYVGGRGEGTIGGAGSRWCGLQGGMKAEERRE